MRPVAQDRLDLLESRAGALVPRTESAEISREVRALAAAASAGHRFLAGGDWSEEIHQSLQIVGEAIGIGELAIYKLIHGDPQKKFGLVTGWSADRAHMLSSGDIERWNPSEKLLEELSVGGGMLDPESLISIRARTGSCCVFAIKNPDGLYGILIAIGMQRDQGFWRPYLEALRLTAMTVGAAIARTTRDQQLIHRATTDSLTGAANRHQLMLRGEEELARALRYGRPLSVAIIDIDRFKAVNDAYGHLVGDRVLVGVAHQFLRSTRKSDLFARYGGEEFCLIMPETSLENALKLVERIRQIIADYRIDGPDGSFGITVSIGLAGADLHNEHRSGFDKLLGRADQLLYRAKSLGRNRTCADIDPCDFETVKTITAGQGPS